MAESMVTACRRGRGPSSGARVLALGGVIMWGVAACARGPAASGSQVTVDTLLGPVDTVSVEIPPGRPVDSLILGSTDAVQVTTGWIVLDARSRRIARLSRHGDLVWVAGREGDGPGEMRHPVSVALLGDRIAVAERDGRLVFFGPNGRPAGRSRVQVPDCRLADVHEILGWRDSLVALTWCTLGSGRTYARVEPVGPDGGAHVLAEWLYNDWGTGFVDPMRFPVLGRVGRDLALGVAPDPCLRILDRGGATVRRLCYPDLPRRPVADSIREQMRHLERSLRTRGIGVHVRMSSPYLPAFRGLVGVGNPWGFRAVPPEGGEAVDWVEAGRLHRIVAPEDGHIFLGTRSILLAVEHVEGTSFAVLPLPRGG